MDIDYLKSQLLELCTLQELDIPLDSVSQIDEFSLQRAAQLLDKPVEEVKFMPRYTPFAERKPFCDYQQLSEETFLIFKSIGRMSLNTVRLADGPEYYAFLIYDSPLNVHVGKFAVYTSYIDVSDTHGPRISTKIDTRPAKLVKNFFTSRSL